MFVLSNLLNLMSCIFKCGVAHLALQCLQVQTLLVQFVLLLLDLLHQLVNASVLSRHQPLEANGKIKCQLHGIIVFPQVQLCFKYNINLSKMEVFRGVYMLSDGMESTSE